MNLVLVSMLVPGALDRGKMMRNLPMLPEVCANSKRKRDPALRKMVTLAWLLMRRREYYRGMSEDALEKKLRTYKIKKGRNRADCVKTH